MNTLGDEMQGAAEAPGTRMATIEIAAGPSLAVRVGAGAMTAGAAAAGAATVAIAVADPELARALTAAIADAVAETMRGAGPAIADAQRIPVFRLRSRRRLAGVAGRLPGAIAVVAVTARNARHLVGLIDGIRTAGAAGIQLVWDGAEPPRARVERFVFAALEHARATPGQPPVVLAPTATPATALHVLVAHAVAHRASLRKDEPR